ncbi:MAG: rhomboid family intramembrane serine protease [Bacteroidales bacterium]|jgi:membrane associated rhomboid family serine protease|nr:rhomboid family intramembrane serine protease [Bacteroidales bacterium]MCI2121565.1 rhomboid family intramembrane serine protease [Bacteroidales bacterium]MCI2145078.1 rhomboid family intramembrane serine protease [Bacteroidales bacterium]
MSYFGNNSIGDIIRRTPAVTNIILLNILMLIATQIKVDWMYRTFALFPFASPFFKWWQLVTHMFMHGGFWHIFFNMYTLWIFGTMLEMQWGSRKFLFFYFVTGIGAALCQNGVTAIELHVLQNQVALGSYTAGAKITQLLSTPCIGASGAIYGVLLGYGMLYPNNRIMLIFPPISLKAIWWVVIFFVIELLTAFFNNGDNVAHFAHLGGMLFGFLLITYWKKRGRLYY